MRWVCVCVRFVSQNARKTQLSRVFTQRILYYTNIFSRFLSLGNFSRVFPREEKRELKNKKRQCNKALRIQACLIFSKCVRKIKILFAICQWDSADTLSSLCNGKIRPRPGRHGWLVCLSDSCHGDCHIARRSGKTPYSCRTIITLAMNSYLIMKAWAAGFGLGAGGPTCHKPVVGMA